MKKHPFAQAKLTDSVSFGSAVRSKPNLALGVPKVSLAKS